MTEDASYPPEVRLHRTSEYDAVYKGGKRCSLKLLVVYAAPRLDPASPTRLGRTVSRKVGKAVVRNRVRRRLRDLFRTHRSRLRTGHDIVINVRPQASKSSYAELLDEFLRAMDRLGLLQEGSP